MIERLIFPSDDRRKLTWKGRFAELSSTPNLHNYYFTGEEVLEVADDADDVDITSGIEWDWEWTWPPVSPNTRRFVWHKQELYKGRNIIYGTGWAGWGFEYPTWQTADGANASTDATLRQYPIFERDPDFMFTNVITQAHVDDILIKGIPALSWPMGRETISFPLGTIGQRNIDMNMDTVSSDGIERPNGWPSGGSTYQSRWLHSQLVYVAHFYAHKLYEKFIEIGGLK